MKAMTVDEWEAIPYSCTRNLPSCRGQVRVYCQPFRPPTEQHRLCEQCVADLSGAPLNLTFVPVAVAPPMANVTRFIPFGCAA
jgi:hypothetical protein